MAALASDRGLVSLSLPQTKPQLAFSHLVMKVSGAEHRPGAFHSLQMAMESHFKGEIVTVNEPLDWRHTSAFSRQVLEIVQAIPPGQTMTYKDIAVQLGKPGAARAVGRAVSRNPFPLVVPCHRVVGSGGGLGGYRGGIKMKRRLLLLEGVRQIS